MQKSNENLHKTLQEQTMKKLIIAINLFFPSFNHLFALIFGYAEILQKLYDELLSKENGQTLDEKQRKCQL